MGQQSRCTHPSSNCSQRAFYLGTLVELNAHDGSIVVKAMVHRKLTLDERLAAFDPNAHSDEAMSVKPIGLEEL